MVAINGEMSSMEKINQNAILLEDNLEQQGVEKDWLISILKKSNQNCVECIL